MPRCSTAASRWSLELKPGRHAWVQLISGELEVNGTRLEKGDGAAISGETVLQDRQHQRQRCG